MAGCGLKLQPQGGVEHARTPSLSAGRRPISRSQRPSRRLALIVWAIRGPLTSSKGSLGDRVPPSAPGQRRPPGPGGAFLLPWEPRLRTRALPGGLPGGDGSFGHDASFRPVSAVRLLGVLGQQARPQHDEQSEQDDRGGHHDVGPGGPAEVASLDQRDDEQGRGRGEQADAGEVEAGGQGPLRRGGA